MFRALQPARVRFRLIDLLGITPQPVWSLAMRRSAVFAQAASACRTWRESSAPLPRSGDGKKGPVVALRPSLGSEKIVREVIRGLFVCDPICSDGNGATLGPKTQRATARAVTRWVPWLRGLDLNQRPLGYEPNELPDCSTPRCRHERYCRGRSLSSRRTDQPIGC